MNTVWHKAHPMPVHASKSERLKWHTEHQKQCGCRPIPKSLLA